MGRYIRIDTSGFNVTGRFFLSIFLVYEFFRFLRVSPFIPIDNAIILQFYLIELTHKSIMSHNQLEEALHRFHYRLISQEATTSPISSQQTSAVTLARQNFMYLIPRVLTVFFFSELLRSASSRMHSRAQYLHNRSSPRIYSLAMCFRRMFHLVELIISNVHLNNWELQFEANWYYVQLAPSVT